MTTTAQVLAILAPRPTVADLEAAIDDALDKAEHARTSGDLTRAGTYIEEALLLHRAMRRLQRLESMQ